MVRYPIKFMVPLGFFMLSLQGLSEIIKRIAILKGLRQLAIEEVQYEKPMQ
jgi:TRAP-type mannitol/chloroaromatic compound transport system permease small subunit